MIYLKQLLKIDKIVYIFPNLPYHPIKFFRFSGDFMIATRALKANLEAPTENAPFSRLHHHCQL